MAADWRDIDRRGYYFLCYRPFGGHGGPFVRRWMHMVGRRAAAILYEFWHRISAWLWAPVPVWMRCARADQPLTPSEEADEVQLESCNVPSRSV